MRFSSDEEFFEEDSKIEIQNKSQNHSQKKKQKKETMLSKFLATLDDDVMKKLSNYQKLKRPIFQRQAVPPLKITLYEDVLFIMTFKDNEAKVTSDAKQIKNVCVDLQSRTKRKQCTIRQRVQKKLCKMTAAEILGHVANDKDISFNLKKELTSGAKIGIERPEKKVFSNEVKTQEKSGMQTPEKQSINKDDIKKEQLNNSPSYSKIELSPQKKDVQIFEEEENIQNQGQKIVEENREVQTEKNIQNEDVNPSQIFIIFKKNSADDQILMFNQMLIHKEVTLMKQKQEEAKKKEQLVNQLKTQMEVIMHFKNQKNAISNNNEIKSLIDEVQKIVKILGLNMNDLIPVQTQSNETKTSGKIQEQTADRNNIEQEQKPNKESIPNEVSQFKAENEQQLTPSESQPSQNQKSYSLSYALCENPEYIKLYNSNPSVFEPLLWTEEQDILVDNFLQDFDQNQKLFNLLIRYKGQQMFVQRCIFLGKNLQESKLLEALKLLKPLNINKLNVYMNSFNSEIQNANDLQNEIMNVITC